MANCNHRQLATHIGACFMLDRREVLSRWYTVHRQIEVEDHSEIDGSAMAAVFINRVFHKTVDKRAAKRSPVYTIVSPKFPASLDLISAAREHDRAHAPDMSAQ